MLEELERRHPEIFGPAQRQEQVGEPGSQKGWEALKRAERKQKPEALRLLLLVYLK